jgi:hypothetical protein
MHSAWQRTQQRAAACAAAKDSAREVCACALQVPRMLLQAGDEEELVRFAEGRKGQSMEADRWWGTFLASRGNTVEALAVFKAADDALSQVASSTL